MSQGAVEREIVNALRQGTVPPRGLDLFATGLEPLVDQFARELEDVKGGQGQSKWLRGEYGSGKTFTARHLATIAREAGFATAEVQVSSTDTPLHKLETVYRRMIERLETPTDPPSALQAVVDAWLYDIGEKVIRLKGLAEDDPAFDEACGAQIEDELARISLDNPAFASVLRAVHEAQAQGDHATAQGLLGWLAGHPHTDRSVLKAAGVRSTVDGQAALTFLRGLLTLLRQSGIRGLVLVLDEVETIQRIPSNQRAKSYEALRQLMDMLSDRRLPGLYLVVTGTPAFFEGPKGIKELSPLYARLKASFGDDPQFDNLKAPQVRLRPFDGPRLRAVGRRVRDLYPASDPEAAARITERVDDAFIDDLVAQLTHRFGGEVALVPRLFLRALVDVIDRVDQHPAYAPREQHQLQVDPAELSDVERDAYERARRGGTEGEDDPQGAGQGARRRRLES